MISFFMSYQAVILPILSALIAWLLPSPLQRANRDMEKNHAAQEKADTSRGYMDDLDRLP